MIIQPSYRTHCTQHYNNVHSCFIALLDPKIICSGLVKMLPISQAFYSHNTQVGLKICKSKPQNQNNFWRDITTTENKDQKEDTQNVNGM